MPGARLNMLTSFRLHVSVLGICIHGMYYTVWCESGSSAGKILSTLHFNEILTSHLSYRLLLSDCGACTLVGFCPVLDE